MANVFQAKEKLQNFLGDAPGINGIGITWDSEGNPCVRVNVDFEIQEKVLQRIPAKIDGIKVLIAQVGQIELE